MKIAYNDYLEGCVELYAVRLRLLTASILLCMTGASPATSPFWVNRLRRWSNSYRFVRNLRKTEAVTRLLGKPIELFIMRSITAIQLSFHASVVFAIACILTDEPATSSISA